MPQTNPPPIPPPVPPYPAPNQSAPGQPLNYQGPPPPGYPPPGYTTKAPPNFGQQAAKASWVAPIIAVGLNVATNGSASSGSQAKVIIAMVGCVFYIIGLVLGIIALSRVGKDGREQVLTPAIVGVCINGGLLLMMIGVVIAAMLR